MKIRKDSEWIYRTLADAFEKETGKKWESYGHIYLKHVIPELEGIDSKTKFGKLRLEVSHIEFEISDE